MKARRRPANSAQAQAEAVIQVAAGFSEPPETVVLRPADRPFWDAVMQCRLPSEWAKVDLVHAAQLARAMADIEAGRALLLEEGDLVEGARGQLKANPRHALIETLSKRCMALSRLLQIHARVVVGKAADLGVQKGEAMAAAQTFERVPDDDLLARPRLQ